MGGEGANVAKMKPFCLGLTFTLKGFCCLVWKMEGLKLEVEVDTHPKILFINTY
jgi:hypothetical protein